jgi:hypothetical protein
MNNKETIKIEKDKNFNIFQALSVANKELIHSSMIGFLISEGFNFFKDISENDLTKCVVNLEVSCNLKIEEMDKSLTKKLRFDIVINFNSSDNLLEAPFMIIENKYKATPTQNQLKLYDTYFAQKAISPIKVLMVFFEEQIPSDVKNYCEINNWKIKSYFSVKDSKLSLFGYLNNVKIEFYSNINKEKQKYLLNEYKEYLNTAQMELKTVVNESNMFSKEYFKNNRDLWFKYLLYIQGFISKKISEELEKTNRKINYISGNDGGSNVIPSIVFWFKDIYFFGIDGNSMKIGFWYKHIEKENVEERKKAIKDAMANSEYIKGLILSDKGIIKNPSVKDKNGSSVMSLASFYLDNWQNKNDFIEDSAKLFIEYYNITNSVN